MNLLLLRSPRRSAPEVPGVHRTRQLPAVAGQIPVQTLLAGHPGGALSLGQLPADTHIAVPTRVHESGGGPIHDRLARPASTGARPPPGERGATT
jgi:hypothetical protein